MKKILRYVSAVIGFISLFLVTMGIEEGLSVPGQGPITLFVVLIILPIGFLFRWLSLTNMSRRKKVINVLDNLFVIFILKGLPTLLGYTSTILQLKLPIYLAIFSTGSILIAIGGIGLLVLNKVPLEKRKSYEDSNIY